MSSATQVISPPGRASYPHIAKAQESMDGKGEPKFSLAIIFDEAATKTPQFAAMKAAVIAAAEDAYPGKGTKMLETGQLKSPFRTDCAAKNYTKDCAVFLNVRTTKKPGVVFSYKDAATGKAKIVPDDQIEKEIYPGAIVRFSGNAYAYNQAGNKGITFGLNNVQKVADGERIDGRQEASEEFADLSEAPAQNLPF